MRESDAKHSFSDADSFCLLSEIVEQGKAILAKILSRNDTSWATDRKKHQNGPYIPAEVREQFFPPLASRSDKPHIREAQVFTKWPQAGGTFRESRLVHYSNKGPETHLTGVPKTLFRGLNPASLLVGWKDDERPGGYCFLILDSAGDAYSSALDLLELNNRFTWGVLQPGVATKLLTGLVGEIIDSVENSSLDSLIKSYRLPSMERMAEFAQREYLQRGNLLDFNPFKIAEPGNALTEVMDIEYGEFRRLELRLRVAELTKALLKHKIQHGSRTAFVSALVAGFDDLLAIFKSVRGSRSTRAGRSFELHLERLLEDGDVPFAAQPMLEGRSPDFVLPTLNFFKKGERRDNDAMILTAKTSTRERWMQVLQEGTKRDEWFLASLDRTISSNVLDSLRASGVVLVVPEYLKPSRRSADAITVYGAHSNVISFRTFFDAKISPKQPLWKSVIKPSR